MATNDLTPEQEKYIASITAARLEAEKGAKLGKRTREQQIKDARDYYRVKRQEIIQDKQNQDKRKERLKLLEKEIDAYEESIDAQDKQLKILHKTIDAFHGLGKAAFEGEGSITAFTDNVRGLGFVGKRLDTNLETFRQLSQTGASFGQSIVTMRESAHSAALPLDDFAKLVADNSLNLAAMFGTTTAGAKRIAELGRITREVGMDRLAPLGFTVDEVNETLLLNLDSQRRSGILNRLSDSQRRNSAINFAEQLDRLAKLTGAQRDELRKQVEQQQSNERFQIALQNATDGTRQRLQGFAATVGNIAPGLNEGFQDLIANAGRPVTESALQLVQNIPEAQSIIQRLIEGTITSEQALGHLRNASIKSMDRFSKATVTGTVEFLRLQGDVINLGRRIVDIDGVYKDQNASVSSLVSNLTTFEQATKVLSSQFQGIETGMLKAFGPALGGLIHSIKWMFGQGGHIAQALAKAPALSATLMIGGLAGKYLFPKVIQVGMIAQGVAMGMRMHGGSTMLQSIFGKGKGGTAGKVVAGAGGKGGRFGQFARSGLGKTVGYTGLAMSGISAGANLMDDDKSNDWSAYGSIGGAVLGGILGSFAGPGGTLLGASLGSMAGQFVGGAAQSAFGKQHGGPITGGNPHLVGEAGPEIIMTKNNANVVSNTDSNRMFDLSDTNKMLAAIASSQAAANKIHSQHLDSLNTSNMINNKTRIATEKSARLNPHQVGLV